MLLPASLSGAISDRGEICHQVVAKKLGTLLVKISVFKSETKSDGTFKLG